MSAHLAHRLPWDALCQVVSHLPTADQRRQTTTCRLKEADEKALRHFGHCLSDAIKEFKTSDRSSAGELELYDPNNWDDVTANSRVYMIGNCGWYLFGYYKSLVLGYIALNLLLIDEEKFVRRFMDNRRAFLFEFLLCKSDGNDHPEFLSSHIRQAFDRNWQLKPLTKEIRQVLRDHAAMLFRCMYSISGQNQLEVHDFTARKVRAFFKARNRFQNDGFKW